MVLFAGHNLVVGAYARSCFHGTIIQSGSQQQTPFTIQSQPHNVSEKEIVKTWISILVHAVY